MEWQDKEAKAIFKVLNDMNQTIKRTYGNGDDAKFTIDRGNIYFSMIEGQLPYLIKGEFLFSNKIVLLLKDLRFTIKCKEMFEFSKITSDNIDYLIIDDYNFKVSRVSGSSINFSYDDTLKDSYLIISNVIDNYEKFKTIKMKKEDVKSFMTSQSSIKTINFREDGMTVLDGNAYCDIEGSSTTISGKFISCLDKDEKKSKVSKTNTLDKLLNTTYSDWQFTEIRNFKVGGVETPHVVATNYSNVEVTLYLHKEEDELALLEFKVINPIYEVEQYFIIIND